MAVKKKKTEKEIIVDEKLEEDIVSKEENLDEDINEDKKKSNAVYKTILVILLILSILCLIVVLIYPRIVLKGGNEIIISYNDSYVESGYKAKILNNDVSKYIKADNNVKEGIVGKYKINYYLDLKVLKIKKTRVVNVVDDVSPLINVDNSVINVCPKEEIPPIQYSAIDEYDGDITSKVEKIVNDDSILLGVRDLANNYSSVSILVNRSDNEKPLIQLKGNSSMFITYGNIFKEPGYSANDNCDGDITSNVKVIGNVGREIGVYELKYEVTDSSGNKETVNRKVIVGVNKQDNGTINRGTIYLTFDDGPNAGTTDKILDILKEKGIKATFFVTMRGPDSLIKRMHDEGHTVALHTATHDYSYVYSSVDNYYKDLGQISDRVKRITGIESKIIRFPGGSSNTVSRSYNRGIMTVLTNLVLNDGYRYFDWNVDGMDASSARNSNDVYYNVTSNLSMNRANVVLLHDIKSITVSALRNIIEFGVEYGYKFSAIDMNTYMVRHQVNN